MAPVTGNNLPAPFSYLLGKDWVTLDTETTGLAVGDEVIEIAVTDGKTGNTLLNSLVRPNVRIDPKAEEVHKISNADVALAPTWPEVREKLIEAVKGKTIVIYNAQFDIRLLMQTNASWNLNCNGMFGANEYFCAMVEYARRVKIYNVFHRSNRNFKLVKAAELEGIPVTEELHRAVADTKLTRDLIVKILAEFETSANDAEVEEYTGDWPEPRTE